LEPLQSPANKIFSLVRLTLLVSVVVLLSCFVLSWLVLSPPAPSQSPTPIVEQKKDSLWHAPDLSLLDQSDSAELIRYGRSLIEKTSAYLGPEGSVGALSNGMNCQNCHLDAGTRPFGNNYSAVASTYPKFRARSGSIETMEKRVNDCIERSLNGKPLSNESREMKAILAWFRWLGSNVEKDVSPLGSGLVSLPFLDRAASPENGKILYAQKCTVCHGREGQGQRMPGGPGWFYPPLWGEHSYNTGAGLYRLSRFAGYIKANMPLGSTFDRPQLSDEEAWDIAAFVNSQPRPTKDLSADWPDISKKPVDHPFGPFSDGFTEAQHKFGPFKPIQEKIKQRSKKA